MTERKAMTALKQVAQIKGVSLETVLDEIDLAIREGMQSSDPLVQERWKQIPSRGEIPTAAELVSYLARLAEDRNCGDQFPCGSVPTWGS